MPITLTVHSRDAAANSQHVKTDGTDCHLFCDHRGTLVTRREIYSQSKCSAFLFGLVSTKFAIVHGTLDWVMPCGIQCISYTNILKY